MKKFFTFLFAALMSISMFGAIQENISIAASDWGWGYNSQVSNQGDLLVTTLTGEWGAVSTGWGETRNLSDWDKIVIIVENMSGCDGEWFKLKAYLRDSTESEKNQMEGLLGLDAEDNQQNYLVIDLKQQKEGFDITAAKILAIQCQPNGAVFKISKVYLEKEGEATPKYYVVGSMTEWAIDANYEMSPNNGAETEEYMYEMALTTTSAIKVVKVQGEAQTWYPDGMGNAYGEHGEITKDGNYTIYFRPKMDGGDDWYEHCIYVASADPAPQPDPTVMFIAFPTVNRPEKIEIAGVNREFTWEMVALDNDPWYVSKEHLNTYATDTIKFRDAANNAMILCEFIPANGDQEGRWQQLYLVMGDYPMDTYKLDTVRYIDDLNLSNASNYAWMENAPEPLPEGIENIVLTEKAQKVIMDGMIYIVRDGKLFNLQGAQVK